MADDDEDDTGNERRKCTLSKASIRYLEKLSKRGTHGSSVSKVMSSLIEEGIRQAIRDKFIAHDDDAG